MFDLLFSRFGAFFCFLLLSATALTQPAAATIHTVPAIAPQAYHAGQSLLVNVLYTNIGEESISHQPAATLHARLAINGQYYPVTLNYKSTDVTQNFVLKPNEARRTEYTLMLPSQLPEGIVELTIAGSAQYPGYLVTVAAPLSTHGADDAAVAQQSDETGREDDSIIQSLAVSIDEEVSRNSFLDNVYAYEPLYFLLGLDPTDAKFQISFKYRFIDGDSETAREHPWLSNFYVAYTQTSFWDLESESIPFEDTNFKPELFYQFNDVLFPFINDNKAHVDLRIGYQHESNGRDGDASRSLNIAYIEPAFHWRMFGDYTLSLAPRAWVYSGGRENNPDIKRFRGRASLTATFGKRDGFQFEAYVRGNPSSGKGSAQLDFSYPLNKIASSQLGFYLQAQLFTGYGENLLNYNQKDTRLRMGFGIVR